MGQMLKLIPWSSPLPAFWAWRDAICQNRWSKMKKMDESTKSEKLKMLLNEQNFRIIKFPASPHNLAIENNKPMPNQENRPYRESQNSINQSAVKPKPFETCQNQYTRKKPY